MFTTDDVYHFIRDGRSYNSTLRDLIKGTSREGGRNLIKYAGEFNEQIVKERNFIKNYRGCYGGVDPDDVLSRFSEIDSQQLSNRLSKNFYNENELKIGLCMASALRIDDGKVSHRYLILDYIKNVHQIGAESVSGFAMVADLGNVKGFFVLKAPRDDDKGEELYHEVYVGLTATNRMRDIVPNFAYIYGEFECSPPLFDSQKNVATMCLSKKSEVGYAIYENVSNSVSFATALKSATLESFLLDFIQVMLALKVAQDRIDFTHYDLHTENVMKRSIPGRSEFFIPYPFMGEKRFIKATGVNMIIDYGMSHVKNSEGESFGHVGYTSPLINYGVRRDRSSPVFDPYKFLCFSLFDLRESNPRLYRELLPLLKFFNTTDPGNYIIKTQREYYFCAPDVEFNMNDFILFCLNFADENRVKVFYTPKRNDYIFRSQVKKPSFEESLVQLDIDLSSTPKPPPSFLEFFDISEAIKSSDPEEAVKYSSMFTKGSSRGESIFNRALEAEKATITQLKSEVRPDISLTKVTFNEREWSNPRYYKSLKENLTAVANYFDSYEKLKISHRVMTKVDEKYSSGLGISEYISELASFLSESRAKKAELLAQVTSQYRTISSYKGKLSEEKSLYEKDLSVIDKLFKE
jgi:hypothetical protein